MTPTVLELAGASYSNQEYAHEKAFHPSGKLSAGIWFHCLAYGCHVIGVQDSNWFALSLAAKKYNPFELPFSLLKTVTASEVMQSNETTHAYTQKFALHEHICLAENRLKNRARLLHVKRMKQQTVFETEYT